MSDFEEEASAKLKATKKPAGTRKTSKKCDPEATEQTAITQFFTQNKVSGKRADSKIKSAEISSKKVSNIAECELVPEKDSKILTKCDLVAKSDSRGAVAITKAPGRSNLNPTAAETKITSDHLHSKVTQVNGLSSRTANAKPMTKAKPCAPKKVERSDPKAEVISKNLVPSRVVLTKDASSPIAVNKNIFKLRQDSLADMSVDPSDDSCLSDLSMIIDDFMSRGVQVTIF